MRKALPVLVAHQISCEKHDRTLFQDIDLSIESGELLLLKGENGAGKTSLLRILVGLSAPSTGNVKINNHCVHSNLDLASSSFVYAGHKLGLSSLLTPVENLRFWSQLHGLNTTISDVNNILTELGLTGLEDLPVKSLSAGQQRRVSLAKLWLHKQAQLWVLDEPLTALDTILVQQLEAHIAAFTNAGGAVIMTSHQALTLEHRARIYELEYAW